MTISVKHTFVSAKGDGSDATLVRPSNWNANHDMQMATSRVLGRLTAGSGIVEELPVTSYMMGILNTADYAALAVLLGLPTTGDAKLTFKAAADTGWILANDGTIGDVGSGANIAAANTLALFTLFYSAPFTDAICPLQTTAGGATTRAANGTAANAFGTNKCRMVIPKTLGRALIIAGSGAGLSSRLLADIGGAETHALTAAQSVDHVHTATGWTGAGTGTGSGTVAATGTCSGTTDNENRSHTHTVSASGTTGTMNSNTSHSHSYTETILGPGTGSSPNYFYSNAQGSTTGATNIDHTHAWSFSNAVSGNASQTHTHTFNGTATVSGTATITSVSVSVTGIGGTTSGAAGFTGAAHNNMQPWTAWNVMIRL